MNPVNHLAESFVIAGHHLLDTLNPWLIALAFFLTWLSLALTAMHLIGFMLGRVKGDHAFFAVMFGGFLFTLFGGAFLWLLGF